jgi:uncharacterized membrane protein SpoIIM required for sporulation
LSDSQTGSLTRPRRILTIIAFFLLSATITAAGVLTPLSLEDSEAISEDLRQVQDEIKDMNLWQSTAFIFANNIKICLLMFIPAAGQFIGFYVLYNTGLVIGAESRVMGMPGMIVLAALFIFPHTWLEFTAYSIALAASSWLIWRLFKRQGKREIVETCKYLAICALILFAAAFIEAYLIVSLPSA